MKTPFRQVSKSDTPKRHTQPADRFGCVAFIAYGYIQDATGEVHHIRNPDFDWKRALLNHECEVPA